MQTLQPTLRLGRDVWDRATMPVEEFRDRADRLRLAMRDAALDAMLLYGRGLNGCGHPTYLSNYVVKLPFAALVVLPRDGDPALMFEGATRGRDAARATTWIEDVRPCWNMADTCLAALSERNLLAGAIGLAGLPRLVPYDEWRSLTAGLGNARLVDAEALVDRQRAEKSAREVAQVRRASRIVDAAMRRAGAGAPTTESALAADVIRDARLAGAEDIRLMIGRPFERDWAFRPPEDQTLSDGEIVFLHLAASWERYWSEAMRTFRVGNGTLERVWSDELERRFGEIAGAVRSGATVHDLVAVARTVLSPSEWRAVDACGFGHGIGITPEEAPVLSDDCGDTIRGGACVAIRAAFDNRGTPVMHGDTIVV